MNARQELTGHKPQKRRETSIEPRDGHKNALFMQFQRGGMAARDLFQVFEDNKELRQIVETLQNELSATYSEKNRAENRLKNAMETVDDHERSIQSLRTQRYEATLYSEQIMKENKSYTEKIYSLENENLLLLEKIKELESNEEVLFDEIQELSNIRCTLELSVGAKAQEVEELRSLLDNTNKSCRCIETDNKLLVTKISTLDSNICELKSTLSSIQCQHAKEMQNLHIVIEAERRKNALLEREAALSFAKKVQNAQNLEIERLIHDKMQSETYVQTLETKNYSLENEIEKAHVTLEKAQDEVESLRSIINDLKASPENDVMRDKEIQINSRCKDFEERLEKVISELKSSEERNSRYEQGYGLREAIVYQKRLEADIRRRDVDLKKLLVEIGEKDDTISLLAKTCEVFQEHHRVGDCSKLKDMNTEAINKIIDEEKVALHRQNRELQQQVNDLEKERNSLMGRLRENALLVEGNGLRLHGLSPEKIDIVLEFVKNLKNGRVQLPLDDKSSKLASDLSSLQMIRQSDVYTIQRLERELEAMRLAQGQSSKDLFESCDFVYLKNAVQEIQTQNEELKAEIAQLRNSPKDGGRGDDDGITVKLSPCVRTKIELIIGREVDENIDVNTMLNIVYDAYDSVKKELENSDMRFKAKELVITGCRKEITELQSRLSNVDVESKEMKPIHVQVNIDQIELKMTQFALKTSERNLVSCEKRIKRLLTQLEWRDKIISDNSRMSVAHTVVKELKACLAQKNLMLAKYRTKSICNAAQTPESDVHQQPLSSCASRLCHAKSSVTEIPPALSTLLTKITRFAEELREKDSIIRKLREEVSNLSVKEKARECYRLSVQDKVNYLIKEKETVISNCQMKYDQMEKEKKWFENLLEDARNCITTKQKEIDYLSETLSRLKKCLKSKNEEIEKLSRTEYELKRTKTSLSLERRAKERIHKVHKESKANALRANDEAEKMRTEVQEIRKSLNEVKSAKLVLDNKCRRANLKIQEMKMIIDDKCCEKVIKSDIDNEGSLKSMIASLQKENSKLREIVASIKIKANLGHGQDKIERNRK